MDLVVGGDLRFHLIKNHKFNEDQASIHHLILGFFAACVLLGL
jgi:hypothetical protein